MKIKDFIKECFGECPGDKYKQKQIIKDLEQKLKIEKEKLRDIELYEAKELAIILYYNFMEANK